MASTTSNSDDTTQSSSTPRKNPRNSSSSSSSSGDSPISSSSNDLAKQVGQFIEEIEKEISKSKDEQNLNKLDRLLRTANSSIEKLKKVSVSIENTKKSADKTVGSGTGDKLPGIISPRTNKKQKISPSAAAILALNMSAGTFLAVAESEVIMCTAGDKAVSPSKRKRLDRLSDTAESQLKNLEFFRMKIEEQKAKIIQNQQPNSVPLPRFGNHDILEYFHALDPNKAHGVHERDDTFTADGTMPIDRTNANADTQQLLDMLPGGHNDPNHINTQQPNISQYLSLPHGPHVPTQVDLNQMQSSVSGVTNVSCMSTSEENNSSMDDVSSGYGGYRSNPSERSSK